MKRSTGVLFLSIILFGATGFFFKKQILLAVGDFLIIEDRLQPVDVIHVIAGNDYRTEYAIRLYQQGFAKHLFFTGGWCNRHNYYHGAHGRDLAIQEGVPAEAIMIDDSTVTSTYSEVERLKSWMDQNTSPVRSVMVVSDPFHMRRAQWTYHQVLGADVGILMAPVPFDQTPYVHAWWTDHASQVYVRDEYKKFVYYVLRYQLAWGPIRDWLASFDEG